MTVRDWLTSPAEWGEWGMRANAWFNELKNEVVRLATTVFWQSADGVRSWYIQDDTLNGRVEEHTDGANWKEVHYNGIRSELHNEDTAVWYENDQTEALLELDKAAGASAVVAHGEFRVEPRGITGGRTFEVIKSPTHSDRINLNFNGSGNNHILSNGIRHVLFNQNEFVFYRVDGATEIARFSDSAGGYFTEARWPEASFNFYANWSDYGGSYAGTKIVKSSHGVVTLEGLVRRSNSDSGAPNAIILLPTWARTNTQRIFTCTSSVGAIRVDVLSNGQVVTNVSIPVNGWVSLCGITFQDT